MSAKYPSVRSTGKLPQSDGECVCCENKAIRFVRVAFSYMRGDDESYSVCQRHFDVANGSTKRLFEQMAIKTKEMGDA